MPAHSLGGQSAWAVTTHTEQVISGLKTFLAAAAGLVGVRIQGAAGQTADLLQFQDSDGNIIARVDADGLMKSNRVDFTQQFLFGGSQ